MLQFRSTSPMLSLMADKNETVIINLRVPESVRQDLKVVSAVEGRTMNEVGTEVLAEGLEKRRKAAVS